MFSLMVAVGPLIRSLAVNLTVMVSPVLARRVFAPRLGSILVLVDAMFVVRTRGLLVSTATDFWWSSSVKMDGESSAFPAMSWKPVIWNSIAPSTTSPSLIWYSATQFFPEESEVIFSLLKIYFSKIGLMSHVPLKLPDTKLPD